MKSFEGARKFSGVLYEKLARIHDSPQKVAAGFGLGVFLGILPGAGPIASLVMSLLLRVNRMAALTGSVLTNTWLSVVTFVLSVKVGSAILGTNWENVLEQCRLVMKNFHWKDLFDQAVWEILKPLLVGYVVVGLGIGILAYGLAMLILLQKRKYSKKA